MAQRALGHNRYGAPLPELSDANAQSLYQTPANWTRQRHIQAVLDDLYRVLLRRGSYAKVTLHFEVQQGCLVPDVQVDVTRIHRCPGEE
jgi:hypothetical protein